MATKKTILIRVCTGGIMNSQYRIFSKVLDAIKEGIEKNPEHTRNGYKNFAFEFLNINVEYLTRQDINTMHMSIEDVFNWLVDADYHFIIGHLHQVSSLFFSFFLLAYTSSYKNNTI